MEECQVCNLRQALFREVGTNRLLCGKLCQIEGTYDDLDFVRLERILINLSPRDLASICRANKKTARLCKTPLFQHNYITRWIDDWQGWMDRAIQRQKWDFIRNWLESTLEIPESWTPTSYRFRLRIGKEETSFRFEILVYLAIRNAPLDIIRMVALTPRLLVQTVVDPGNAYWAHLVHKENFFRNLSAFHYAIRQAPLETIIFLHQEAHFEITLKIILQAVSWNTNPDVISYIFDQVPQHTEYGLFMAISYNQFDIVKLLLNRNFVPRPDGKQWGMDHHCLSKLSIISTTDVSTDTLRLLLNDMRYHQMVHRFLTRSVATGHDRKEEFVQLLNEYEEAAKEALQKKLKSI